MGLIEYGSSYEGYLGPDTGHEAVFQFEGSAGDEVGIAAFSEDFDTELWIEYDGREIGYNDDWEEECCDAGLFLTLPDNGLYTIKVRDRNADDGSNGGYFGLGLHIENQLEMWSDNLMDPIGFGTYTGRLGEAEVHVYPFS